MQPLNIRTHFRIASPCPASWHSMSGDGQKRRCPRCKLDAYNPAGMTEERRERMGRARLYVRSDGTFMPLDCPVGARDFHHRAFFLSGGGLLTILGWLLTTAALASAPHGSGHLRLGVPDANPNTFTINAIVARWVCPAPSFFPASARLSTRGNFVPILQADWERAWLEEHAPLFDEHAHDMELKFPELGEETFWNQREIAALDLLRRAQIECPRPPSPLPISPEQAPRIRIAVVQHEE